MIALDSRLRGNDGDTAPNTHAISFGDALSNAVYCGSNLLRFDRRYRQCYNGWADARGLFAMAGVGNLDRAPA